MEVGHKGGTAANAALPAQHFLHASISIETSSSIIRLASNHTREDQPWSEVPRNTLEYGAMTMGQYAMDKTTVNEAVSGGGLLVVARWEAKDGQADKVADILSRFLPEAQREPGAKLFLISRAKDNPAQFLFYELFADEAAFKAHQESAHFKAYIAGQALPLLANRERAQYALL
jgi:quinol monooxygenase YgiN